MKATSPRPIARRTLLPAFATKVEHILAHGELLAELATLGASFVVSAFESPSDHVLGRLEKGHTAADMDAALVILDRAGLTVQPT